MSTKKDVKPRSTATINPNAGQRAGRNIGRIKTLRVAIKKHTERGNTSKVKSLQTELDRRLGEVAQLREELENV